MASFLSSRRLLTILALLNFILISYFIVLDRHEASIEQRLSSLTSKRTRFQQEITLWEKFGSQLINSGQKSPDSLSTEISQIIKFYALNSALFTETKNGFNLKMGAKTDWDIYLVTHALQKHFQGRYILSHLTITRAGESEGVTALFQWIK